MALKDKIALLIVAHGSTVNPDSGNFCRGRMRLLERGTESARCAFLVRSRIDPRSLRRTEFYQRRLLHSNCDPPRAGVEWPHDKTTERANMEILSASRESSRDD